MSCLASQMYENVNPVFLSTAVGGQWSSVHDWFYLISNIAVWAACIILPIFICIYIFKKGKDDVFFRQLYMIFALFLFINGLSYLVDALVFFNVSVEMGVIAKMTTAVMSWILVIYAVGILSNSLSMKSRKELMEEIGRRMQMEYDLKVKIERLLESERNVRLGYIHWDLVTDRVEISDMAADVLGLHLHNASDYQSIMEQLNNEQRELVEDFLNNKLLRTKTLTSYFRILTTENEERYVLVKAEITKNSLGDPVTVSGSIQNVSELRELQKMEEQKRKLKEIAWVQSHRMRSPVATILGMADLFNYDDPADPMNAEVLGHIKELTQKLDEMIREVDALTRVKEEVH